MKTTQIDTKPKTTQHTINLATRWIELLDYERDGYEFQGAH